MDPAAVTMDMDTGANTTTESATTEQQLRVDRSSGRTAVAVTGVELSSSDDAGGWTVTGKQVRQRLSANNDISGESPPPLIVKPAVPNRAAYAKRIATRLVKAARMPRTLPREDIKIVMRPRGGLNVARTEASILMSAVLGAVGMPKTQTQGDTICTNGAQNIIIVSTPDEERARRYAGARSLHVGGQNYEISAYRSAPNGTAKGIIRGIAVDDTAEEIVANIVNPANPLALDAHRIGTSTTIIVLFAGERVPNYVKYGSILVKCSLYRQHYEVCRQCGKVGHRTDVCPFPNTKVCFACGTPNPGVNHDKDCKPKCKLCGGPHPTGATGCTNRYKTPYVVTRRRWERLNEAQEPPPLGLAEYPQLQPKTSGGKGRSRSRQRSGSRRRSTSQRRSVSRGPSRKGHASRSKERVAWVDIVKPPAAATAVAAADVVPPKQAQMSQAKQSPQNSEVHALRVENERLKQRIAEQDATIAEINEKLTRLIELQQRQSVPSSRSSSVETEEGTCNQACTVRKACAKRRAPDSSGESGTDLEERFDRFEAATNRRLAALEATQANINTRLTALEQTCQTMQADIKSLQVAAQSLQTTVQSMQETLLQIQATITTLGAGPHNPSSSV